MEEKNRITVKVTLDTITTLEDVERFVATARQVLDHPELMLVNNTTPAGHGAGLLGLVAIGTPKTAQHATSGTEAPKVPERITEWPEDDEHLRAHRWRDQDRDILSWVPASGLWECFDLSGDYVGSYGRPQIRGPWTRVEGADL